MWGGTYSASGPEDWGLREGRFSGRSSYGQALLVGSNESHGGLDTPGVGNMVPSHCYQSRKTAGGGGPRGGEHVDNRRAEDAWGQ